MQQGYTILPLGDGALTVSFGNAVDEGINEKVLRLFYQVKATSFPFVLDVVPAYGSLTIYYDVLFLHTKNKSAFEQMKETVLPFLQEAMGNKKSTGRAITIPVCYAKTFSLDIEGMASQKNLSADEIVQLHTGKNYRVYMIGFLPGFPYMGKVDSRIATPRKNNPRTLVPAGSVGIAGEQTGIYPLASPGGWNIIGRTPLKLFDPNKSDPVLLQPGDNVTFVSITEDEFEDYQSRIA
jgi:inhibitor of KinA